jgi:hypothetical protein
MTRMISNWFVALGFLWVMLASASVTTTFLGANLSEDIRAQTLRNQVKFNS